jgi:hypothetical protein
VSDEADAPAGTDADADISGRAARRYQVRRGLLAALTAAGLRQSLALAAVLAYRLVNFWLILMCGWLLMALLARRPTGPQAGAPGPGERSAIRAG